MRQNLKDFNDFAVNRKFSMILTFWGLSNQIKVPTWSSLSLPFAAREIFKYVGPCWLEMWFHFLQRKFCHVTLNGFPITKAELHLCLCLGKFILASKLKNFTEWSDWQSEKDQMLVTRPTLTFRPGVPRECMWLSSGPLAWGRQAGGSGVGNLSSRERCQLSLVVSLIL